MSDQNTSILRIGDYVTFKNVKFSSLLCAEGILLEDIIANDKVKVLDDCLFCIHLQRQYSAARELEEFLKAKKDSTVDESHNAKYFQALKRGSDNENKLNDSYMKNKLGQVIVFGDIIQLFHVKSGKYLTVVPDLLAKDERENIRVVLDTNGNSYSWLQIMPRYKIDREGDNILSRSEVYLRVSERANEYIHRADRDPMPGHEREVNCSLETTSWRMSIFQSSTDSLDKGMLLASQLVYINDPETRCNLTIALPALESLDGDVEDDSKSEERTQANAEEEDMGYSTKLLEEVQGDSSVMIDSHEAESFYHEYGDFILQPYQNYINSDSLWFVESKSLLIGGPIKLKTDRVRLKHMNTGLYLLCAIVERLSPNTHTLEDEIVFTTTSNPDLPGTLFTVTEVNGTSKYLSNGKALQIGYAGSYIERGDNLEENYIVKGTKDKTAALNLIIHRYTTSSVGEGEESASAEHMHASKEPLDVYVGLAARGYLRKYHNMTVIPRNDTISTVWPAATRSDMDFFRMVIQKVVFFSQGFPISSKDVQLGIDKADLALRRQRQSLLREQNTLEVVLRVINRLTPVSDALDRMKNGPAKKKKVVVSEAENAMLMMGTSILGMCFNLLYYSILDNQENQMYVADFMPVLLAHLSSQPLAGKCVTEMLSKNIELQETKIGTREIQIFVDKLRSSKMNAMYLQLLQACCSCEGEGVDGNQCKVANMLFSDTNDIIINLSKDNKHLEKVHWGQPSLYVPASPVPGSPIDGEVLISAGLPLLSIAWTTNSIDFSPLGLFGKLSVSVKEHFARKPVDLLDTGKSAGSAAKGKSKKKTNMEQKEAVANYFVAELFLGAEMCMDRNYVAINKLKDMFDYEMLVTILKLDVTNHLKSAAVRLLMCLHVDRDPQATSKIPLLTRTWSAIERHNVPQLPYVDAGRRYKFALIQQLIHEHIAGMAGVRWDDLSRHMLMMLRTLVQFNFYGTNERMTDVIGPLISALDRRRVGAAEEKEVQAAVERLESAPAVGASAPGAAYAADVDASRDIEESRELLAEDAGENANPTEEAAGPSWVETGRSLCRLALNLFTAGNAARVMAVGEDVKETKVKKGFQNPIRYDKAPLFELETMVEAVDILAFAQRVIEDRNISLLLRYFYSWQAGQDKRTPSEIFEQVVEDSKQLSLDIAEFDAVMLDVLMFVHMPLTQSTLEVLMAHHSMRRILLDNANNVQLLASSDRERQYRMVDSMLQQLEQNAETHELWGELASEADLQANKQTMEILKDLTNICRIRRTVLEFDEEFMADTQIQDLYRNLGCFEICLKVMGLLDSVEEDEDGNLSEVALNTRELCLRCNTLLYWYFLGNAKNQEQGFGEIEMFLDSVDDEINSHLVIGAIFKGNEALMRMIPHSHLSDFVEKIIKNGKSHHYLSLFAAISHVGEKNIPENQLEIVKTLTSPGRLAKLACFFCPVDHPDYQQKVELMEPFLDSNKDLALDDLPEPLSYHLMFLEVLSGCTVGRANMQTVEAKVQSVFNYVDILQAILHPGTITTAKMRLCKFFYNSIIEVELKIPGLEQVPVIWQLLESFKLDLNNAKDLLLNAEKLGWEHPTVSRQRIEYVLVAIMIIGGFFKHYYRAAAFQPEDRTAAAADPAASTAMQPSSTSQKTTAAVKTSISLTHVDEVILYFFTKIKEVHDLNCRILSEEHKTSIYDALDTLNKSTSSEAAIMPNIRPILHGVDNGKNGDESEGEIIVDPEQALIANYKSFLRALSDDTDCQEAADNENVAFIKILESLPFTYDPVEADVRYETLIRKLVFHIRENITIVNGQKRLDARVTKTSTWIIKAFRTMIENKMGMSIDKRDDEGGAEEDEKAAPVVNALNSCGGTALCLDLIADGIDVGLQLEAVKLGVGLLFKEGGALEVQNLMHNHLSKTNSELFFKQVRITLQKLREWHEWNNGIRIEPDAEPPHPDSIRIVRFLQLMCEGHFLPNQDIMREQPNNPVSYNLLDDYVEYLNCLSRIPCRTSTTAAIRITATILEVIQGPCDGNQAHFALNTELIETLNRLNRAKMINDCREDEEVELKKTAIDIFQGLLEGQGEKSPVYERVLSVIHLDIIQLMSKGSIVDKDGEESVKSLSKVTVDEELEEQKEILQTECIVLLQMLCNFKPSLYEELGISRNIEDIVGSGTAMIEVIWRGDIHRRFFHVPNMCSFLAKSSKDALVASNDRSNSENKLIDFLNRSHELYREAKHQQYLTKLGVSSIFSRKNQDRATWITFILAFLTNLMLLVYYTAGDMSQEPSLENEAVVTIRTMNLLQVIFAAFVILLFVVVRSPVRFASLEASGLTGPELWIKTASDPMILYYCWYFAFTAIGQMYSYDFLPFLLLDIIVKNSTTRDVLNAVIVPRAQILMGGVVILFIVQIYAFALFMYYRDAIQEGHHFCDTLWGCYKMALGYGLRNGGGIGYTLNNTVGLRWALDVSFFFVVNVGMLNLVAGVIITTFGQLREEQARIKADTEGVCFICGIDRQVFDRASAEPEGFKTHTKVDHNMWNYLYFIFMLWEQDKDDDDGLEQYVRRAIDANEITWFPLNKAIRLEQAASAEEALLHDLKKTVVKSETGIATTLDKFQTNINIVLEQLNQALKQDHIQERVESRAATRKARRPSLTTENLRGESQKRPGSAASQGKTLILELLEITNLNIPANQPFDRLICNVTIGSTFQTIPCNPLSKANNLTFGGENKFRLLDGVQAGDERSVTVQLMKEVSNPFSLLELQAVQIPVNDLLLAESAVLEVFFTLPGVEEASKLCVFPTCVGTFV